MAIACANHDGDIVGSLIKGGCSVEKINEKIDREENTILHTVCLQGNLQIGKPLLSLN